MTRGKGIHLDVGRQSPAAGAHLFLGQPNIFFVTVNAKNAVPWMADPVVQRTLTDLWSKEVRAWLVGYYLLMPDHLHFFCAPRDLHFGIDQWIEFWKRQFSRRHLDQSWTWQRKSFHHRMRNRIAYEEKLAYVRENPVRQGLVAKPEDRSFQGHIHDWYSSRFWTRPSMCKYRNARVITVTHSPIGTTIMGLKRIPKSDDKKFPAVSESEESPQQLARLQ